METGEPEQAGQRYLDCLQDAGVTIANKRVLIFGYGGYFAVGCILLKQGAGHVVLCDKYASPDNERNRKLAAQYPQYLAHENLTGPVKNYIPHPQYITLVQDDIRLETIQAKCETVDIVLSTSVYEHLDDAEGITKALARITQTGGIHIHFIDLRDHYFKLPFEMLHYSESTWKGWLNPTSNLNRFRLKDYQRIFEKYFSRVEVTILGRDLEGYQKARPSIRAEFISGDDQVDSVTILKVVAIK
jgi:SAM-dependent methyltransferase